jgi:hypothetical protein
MKKIVILIIAISVQSFYGQTFTTNRTPVGMEHNLLFNASTRYQVTQTGSAPLNLSTLFDGKFVPSYTSTAPTSSNPTEITIVGLPNAHIQGGAWLGWSTRWWQAKNFKIEGYDSYNSPNGWKTIADYSTQNYTGGQSFSIRMPSGAYTKLRFTFYSATGANGRLGVSELFFIHPEATAPYEGLFSNGNTNSTWEENGSTISYSLGNVGIGTSNPLSDLHIEGTAPVITFKATNLGSGVRFNSIGQNGDLYRFQKDGITKVTIKNSGSIGIGTNDTKGFKLAVNGNIHTKEVKVDLIGWSDFVFFKDYKLPTLEEVEAHIAVKGHLKDIPSAKEVKENGIFLGDMNAKLLQKIEELTLYTIAQEKKLTSQEKKITAQQKAINQLESLKKRFDQLEKLIKDK